MEYKLEYKVFQDGIIEEYLKYESPLEDLHKELNKRIMDTRDEGVRKALIELGWTPPKEKVTERRLRVFPNKGVLNYYVGETIPGTVFTHINGNILFYNTCVAEEGDLLKLKGTRWDDIWVHPDVKWGLAQEILLLNRK